MIVTCHVDSIPSQCGGKIIHDFRFYADEGRITFGKIKKSFRGKMLIATFNQNQKLYYDACCKTFTWLGQSEPILNKNTDNYIFTVVFKA